MGLRAASSLAIVVLCLLYAGVVTSADQTTPAATSEQLRQAERPVISEYDNEVDIFDPSARDPLAGDYEDNGIGFENLSDGEDPNNDFEILDGDLEAAGTSNVHRKVPHPHGAGYPRPRQVPRRPTGGYPRPTYRSPYSVLPGSYSKNSYAGPRYQGSGPYNRHSIYASYLNSKSYMNYAKQCLKSYGQTPRLMPKDLSSAFGYAANMITSHAKYEAQMYSTGNYVNASQYSNAARHQVGVYSMESVAPQYAKEKEAMFNEYASKFLMHHYCLSKMQANYMLPTIKIGPATGNPYSDHSCYAGYGSKQQQHCADSKYRTVDGSCNNLYNPYWGKAKVCHVRFLSAAYEDGVSAPRIHGASGHPLPNPRIISTMAHAPRQERSYYTNIKVMWGQFLNHDVLLTATSVADYKGGAIKCCPSPSHPQCLPITIPSDDYYQSRYKKTCINFVRSAPCPLCTLGPREQQNLATSFIDLSLVYGASHADLKRVRSYQGGYLKTGVNKCGKPILPPSPKPHGDQCSSPHKSIYCFDAGDPRVNQHPGLMLLHTLAVRAHNHHAQQLYRVNAKWSDERLFQEARRITIAQFQHITYHEYLPVLFGPTLLKYYDLEVNYGAGYTRYEPYTDPTTWNDYTIAARYGHSQVTSFYSLMGKGYNATGGYWLRDSFFDPKHMHECGGDAVVQGLIHDPAMSVDPWVDGDVHNYLYRVRGEPVGSDLPAFNIQRSRDHGIPSYHSYLEFCFGMKVRGWDDMGKFIPYEQLVIFKKLYKDWRDVELWPAVISERKFPDADIGPTAACIVGIQFYHLKYGDRYFYSHGYQTGSFTPRQLSNIKQVSTLASYLCLTGEYMPAVQKYAFFPPSRYNSPVPCNRFPQIDYNLWRESY